MLMSAITGNTTKYKVSSVTINGNFTGLASVPSLYFTGGGLATAAAAGAAGYFNYATINGYYYNTGNYYADTQYSSLGSTTYGGGIMGTTVNTTSGSITYGGYNLGSFTASTKTVATSGGALASVTITRGGEYRRGGPPFASTQPLASGPFPYIFFPDSSVFGAAPIGTCMVTFTNGVVTSVNQINTSGYPGPYTDTATSTFINADGLYNSTGGDIYATGYDANKLATVSFTRTPLVYSYPITVDTISPNYTMIPNTPGPITVSYGGTTISVTLSAETAYQPTYYNLQSVTLTQVGSYYTTAVTPISSNGSVTLTANMVIA